MSADPLVKVVLDSAADDRLSTSAIERTPAFRVSVALCHGRLACLPGALVKGSWRRLFGCGEGSWARVQRVVTRRIRRAAFPQWSTP